jgi:hypothetical protein
MANACNYKTKPVSDVWHVSVVARLNYKIIANTSRKDRQLEIKWTKHEVENTHYRLVGQSRPCGTFLQGLSAWC